MEYKVKVDKISLPIEGMTCASCVTRVEKSITKIEGVTDVAVNLATEKATFNIDKSKTGIDEIKKVVEEAGYKINLSSLDEEQKSSDTDDELEKSSDYDLTLKKDFLFALILTIPIFILSMSQMFEGIRELIPFTDSQLKILFPSEISNGINSQIKFAKISIIRALIIMMLIETNGFLLI